MENILEKETIDKKSEQNIGEQISLIPSNENSNINTTSTLMNTIENTLSDFSVRIDKIQNGITNQHDCLLITKNKINALPDFSILENINNISGDVLKRTQYQENELKNIDQTIQTLINNQDLLYKEYIVHTNLFEIILANQKIIMDNQETMQQFFDKRTFEINDQQIGDKPITNKKVNSKKENDDVLHSPETAKDENKKELKDTTATKNKYNIEEKYKEPETKEKPKKIIIKKSSLKK